MVVSVSCRARTAPKPIVRRKVWPATWSTQVLSGPFVPFPLVGIAPDLSVGLIGTKWERETCPHLIAYAYYFLPVVHDLLITNTRKKRNITFLNQPLPRRPGQCRLFVSLFSEANKFVHVGSICSQHRS